MTLLNINILIFWYLTIIIEFRYFRLDSTSFNTLFDEFIHDYPLKQTYVCLIRRRVTTCKIIYDMIV